MSRSCVKRLAAILLIILVPSISQAKIRVGRISCDSPPAVTLNDPTPLPNGLMKASFLNNVGGIAFGGVAAGPADVQAIHLQYLPNYPDGLRLWVRMRTWGGEKSVFAPIHDWQLVPIAKFAAGEQAACLTLFGDLKDRADAEARRSRGEKILNYHPAFENSLLGLRLAQADIQILYPDACDLPDNDGQYILGPGEVAPNPLENYHAYNDVRELIKVLNWRDGNHQFRSYVICDHDRPVTYSAEADRLKLTGDPLWYCWRARDDNSWGGKNRLANATANSKANRLLNEEYQVAVRAFRARMYTKEYQRRRFEFLFNNAYDYEMRSELLAMPEYSADLSKDIRELEGINPAVYDALVTTMRYAAFFRDVKRRDPAGYDKFLRTLEGVAVAPVVKTPTTMSYSDNDSSPAWLPREFEQDWVTVTGETAPVQQEDQTVTTVKRGQSFRVLGVQDSWYRVRVLDEDGAKYGWINSGHVSYQRRRFALER